MDLGGDLEICETNWPVGTGKGGIPRDGARGTAHVVGQLMLCWVFGMAKGPDALVKLLECGLMFAEEDDGEVVEGEAQRIRTADGRALGYFRAHGTSGFLFVAI